MSSSSFVLHDEANWSVFMTGLRPRNRLHPSRKAFLNLFHILCHSDRSCRQSPNCRHQVHGSDEKDDAENAALVEAGLKEYQAKEINRPKTIAKSVVILTAKLIANGFGIKKLPPSKTMFSLMMLE
ncbi:hypothetical protein HDU78_010669 [Chytriomyces hyalinus]|nr:hypothetical protein HDU78_010669 [Chytriomyces hyalinus]